jgi:hypothetical protein
MVRVKVVCKDSSKIPKKRLFEMLNSLYVIHFKVEGRVEAALDEDDGGDNEDPDLGDDNGMEEFHHDPLPDSDASKGKEQGGLLLEGSSVSMQILATKILAPRRWHLGQACFKMMRNIPRHVLVSLASTLV